MSRKVIRDFIRQADSIDGSQATAYFETIVEVYEDSVHTAAERVATLESDTLWLLAEYRKIVEAKDNSPEEKQKHRIAQSNLWQLLSVLIASTADKGIYLSEAFIKKYDKVEFVGSEFGKYVRDSYSVRKWKPAGNGNETPPEGENVPQTESYIELTPELQTTDRKAEKVFTAAFNVGWIKKRSDKGYQWVGFEEISRTRKLAYMCANIYDNPSWKNLESFFREKGLGRDWGNVKNQIEPDGTGRQPWMNRIDILIAKALQ